MSDDGLANDLFGDSDNEAAPPVLSASVSVKDEPPAEGIEDKPLLDDDDDGGGDLFGDDDDEPPRDRGETSSETPPSRTQSPNPLEYPEEYTEQIANEVWVTLPLPKLPRIKATDGKVWHLRLPAYVNIESKPFEPDYYRETLDEEATSVKDINSAKIRMIGVRNTIRWRWVTGSDGQPTRQSNARILRWSDGSVSLQLGQEMFDVAASSGSSLARPTDTKPIISGSQAPSTSQPPSSSSTTFLCTAAVSERVLMTETSIAGQLSLQPTSMNSKTHMELVKHVGQQHVKHSRMKILEDIQDQEKVSALLLQAGRGGVVVTPAKSSKGRTGGSGRGGRSGGSRVRRAKNVGSDSEDDQSDSPRGGRSSARTRLGRANLREEVGVYDEDDGFVVADDDDEEAVETEDSDDMAYGSSRKKGSSKKNQNKSGKRKSSGGSGRNYDDDEEEDEMELAEKRIEQMEREKKRAKREAGGGGGGKKSKEFVDSEDDDEKDAEGEEDMEMDVESEDD